MVEKQVYLRLKRPPQIHCKPAAAEAAESTTEEPQWPAQQHNSGISVQPSTTQNLRVPVPPDRKMSKSHTSTPCSVFGDPDLSPPPTPRALLPAWPLPSRRVSGAGRSRLIKTGPELHPRNSVHVCPFFLSFLLCSFQLVVCLGCCAAPFWSFLSGVLFSTCELSSLLYRCQVLVQIVSS